MSIPQLSTTALARLNEVYQYNILDSLPEEEFDNITRIASAICQAPISLITILDEKRQWFKSSHGLVIRETPLDQAFCAHAILHPGEVMVVQDANKDSRFAGNPLVTGQPQVIFYAGVPLVTENGHALGTLCVIDHQPRELSATQQDSLKALASQVCSLLELRKKQHQLQQQQQVLQEVNEQLERFTAAIARDLQSPCTKMQDLSNIILQQYGNSLGTDGQQMLLYLKHYASNIQSQIQELLDQACTAVDAGWKKEHFTLHAFLEELKSQVALPDHFTFRAPVVDDHLFTSRVLLLKILQPLLQLGSFYNSANKPFAELGFRNEEKEYLFTLIDNGCGIPDTDSESLVNMLREYFQLDPLLDYHAYATGIKQVRMTIEQAGGKAMFSFEQGQGSVFSFTVRK